MLAYLESRNMVDRVGWILWTGSALAWAIAALGILGEVLGWWNLLGEVMAIGGSVGGLLLGAAGLVWTASRRQVHLVATGVVAAHTTLDTIDRKLDKLDALDEHTVLLREIRDRL